MNIIAFNFNFYRFYRFGFEKPFENRPVNTRITSMQYDDKVFVLRMRMAGSYMFKKLFLSMILLMNCAIWMSFMWFSHWYVFVRCTYIYIYVSRYGRFSLHFLCRGDCMHSKGNDDDKFHIKLNM